MEPIRLKPDATYTLTIQVPSKKAGRYVREPRTMMTEIDAARQVLVDATRLQRFPAAVAEVGSSDRPLWLEAFGTLTFDQASATATIDTPFDLASLTKVVATVTTVMQLVQTQAVGLDELLSELFSEWRGEDRELVSVRDLLEHASGLAARLVDQPPKGRREFEHDICTMRLAY